MKINQLISKLQQIKNQDAIIKIKAARDVDSIANDIEELFIQHEEGSNEYALYPVDNKEKNNDWNTIWHNRVVHNAINLPSIKEIRRWR